MSSSGLVEQRPTPHTIRTIIFTLAHKYYKQLNGQLEAIVIEEALPDNWNGNVNGVPHAQHRGPHGPTGVGPCPKRKRSQIILELNKMTNQ